MEISETDLQSMGITDSGGLQRLMDLADLKRQVQNGNHSSMLAVYYRLLHCTNCACRFEQNGNQNSLINLGFLSQSIGEWDDYVGTNDLQSFLKYLEMSKQGGVSQLKVPSNDSIQVMSIHQAKGLEFPVVMMGSVVNGHLPNRQRSESFNIPYDLRASGQPEVEDPHLVDERKLSMLSLLEPEICLSFERQILKLTMWMAQVYF